MQLQSQDELTRLQIEQAGQQYDQTRSDNKRNQWWNLAGGIIGTALPFLLRSNEAPGEVNQVGQTSGYTLPPPAQSGPMPIQAGNVGVDQYYSGAYQSPAQPRTSALDGLATAQQQTRQYSNNQLINFLPYSANADSWRIRR